MIIIGKPFFSRSTLFYIEQAIDKFEKSPSSTAQNREPSVLEKLLKVDKHVAVVMALDMLLAGVDTVKTLRHFQ